MKTVLVVVMVLVVSMAAVAQDGHSVPFMKAQLIAQMELDGFIGHLSYVDPDNSDRWVYGQIMFNADLKAEQIKIDDVILFDDPENPTSLLPRPSRGVKYFNFYLVAMDANDIVMSGSYSKKYFDLDDMVNIILEVDCQTRHVEFELPQGVNPQDVVILGNPNTGGPIGGWYDEEAGAFHVRLNPDWGTIEYQIVNQVTGEILAVGEVGLVPDDSPESEGFGVSFQIEEGIDVVDMTQEISSLRLPGREFETTETLNGVERDVKIFVLKRFGYSETWVHLNNFYGEVMAYESLRSGSVEPWLAEFVPTPLNCGFGNSLFIPAGAEEVILVFYAVDSSKSFDALFAKWQMGGKG